MRTKLAPLIALLFALGAAALGWQRHGVLALKKQVASLTRQVANKDDALREQAVLLDRLQEENGVYSKEFASLRDKVSNRVSPPGVAADGETVPSPSSKDGTTKMFSRMTEDPKMKEVARQWHLARLKQIYGDFVKERKLSPQQSKQFFDLLTKDDSRARDADNHLFDEGEGSAKEIEAQSEAQKAELERQLRMLLGDDNYAGYEVYKQTADDRSTLLQIRERLGSTGTSLRDDQAKALLETMMEERTWIPPPSNDSTAPPSENRSNREKFAAFLESGFVERFYEAQMDRNQRIRSRVEGILSPEQLQELERFQTESLEMQRVKLETAREMIGQRNDGPAMPAVVSTPSP